MGGLSILLLVVHTSWAAYSLEWQLGGAPVCGNNASSSTSLDLCQFFVRRDPSDERIAALTVSQVATGSVFAVSGSTRNAPATPSCGSYVSMGLVVVPDGTPDCTSTDPSFKLNATVFQGGWYCTAPPSERPADERLFVAQLAVARGATVDLNLTVIFGAAMQQSVRAVCNAPATTTPAASVAATLGVSAVFTILSMAAVAAIA